MCGVAIVASHIGLYSVIRLNCIMKKYRKENVCEKEKLLYLYARFDDHSS